MQAPATSYKEAMLHIFLDAVVFANGPDVLVADKPDAVVEKKSRRGNAQAKRPDAWDEIFKKLLNLIDIKPERLIEVLNLHQLNRHLIPSNVTRWMANITGNIKVKKDNKAAYDKLKIFSLRLKENYVNLLGKLDSENDCPNITVDKPELTDIMRRLQDENGDLRQQIKDKDEELIISMEKLLGLHAELTKTCADLDETAARLEDVCVSEQKVKEERQGLQKLVNELQEKAHASERQVKEERQQLQASHNEQLDAFYEYTHAIREELDNAKDEVSDLKTKNETLISDNHILSTNNEVLKNANHLLCEKHLKIERGLRDEVTRLQKELYAAPLSSATSTTTSTVDDKCRQPPPPPASQPTTSKHAPQKTNVSHDFAAEHDYPKVPIPHPFLKRYNLDREPGLTQTPSCIHPAPQAPQTSAKQIPSAPPTHTKKEGAQAPPASPSNVAATPPPPTAAAGNVAVSSASSSSETGDAPQDSPLKEKLKAMSIPDIKMELKKRGIDEKITFGSSRKSLVATAYVAFKTLVAKEGNTDCTPKAAATKQPTCPLGPQWTLKGVKTAEDYIRYLEQIGLEDRLKHCGGTVGAHGFQYHCATPSNLMESVAKLSLRDAFLELGLPNSENLIPNERLVTLAHRKLALILHPDKVPDPVLKQKASECFRQVTEAKEIALKFILEGTTYFFPEYLKPWLVPHVDEIAKSLHVVRDSDDSNRYSGSFTFSIETPTNVPTAPIHGVAIRRRQGGSTYLWTVRPFVYKAETSWHHPQHSRLIVSPKIAILSTDDMPYVEDFILTFVSWKSMTRAWAPISTLIDNPVLPAHDINEGSPMTLQVRVVKQQEMVAYGMPYKMTASILPEPRP